MVRLGQPVAILGKPGEDFSALAPGAASVAAAPSAPAAPAPAADEAAPAPEAAAAVAPEAATAPVSSLDATGRIKASPYVRKLAREQGLDLGHVAGTGPNGRVIARDLSGAPAEPRAVAAVAAVPPAPTQANAAPRLAVPEPARLTPTAPASAKRIPLSMMRKTIARRLTQSKQTVPHFYLTIDVDAGALVALREQLNQDLAAGKQELKVSFNDLVVKAVAIALRRVPACNASFTEEALLLHERVDLSIAVAVPDGLVTPVVRDADRKSVLELAAEVRDLATRARDKKLRPEEMSDGTFSISNLGMFGIDAFSAVINPPEGAILAVGRVRPEPVVRGSAVVPGHKLGMTLSCDHRVIDGAVGASFLAALRTLLEHPMQLLVG
jgi:pyruvate dehydrogenase E2 component (dihydrolipoamide acetyltransferase)